MSQIIRNSDGMLGFSDAGGILIVATLVALFCIGVFMFEDLNDEAYFKTLDKLNCEQIWILMQTGTDWDTMDYYGDRCN